MSSEKEALSRLVSRLSAALFVHPALVITLWLNVSGNGLLCLLIWEISRAKCVSRKSQRFCNVGENESQVRRLSHDRPAFLLLEMFSLHDRSFSALLLMPVSG